MGNIINLFLPVMELRNLPERTEHLGMSPDDGISTERKPQKVCPCVSFLPSEALRKTGRLDLMRCQAVSRIQIRLKLGVIPVSGGKSN